MKIIDTLTRNEQAFEKARNIVPFVYYFFVLTAVNYLASWRAFLDRADFSPIWPVSWMNYFNNETTLKALIVLFLSSAFLGAFFFWNRIARIIAFLGIFLYSVLSSSYGGVPDHRWYLLLFVTFLFIFLPDFRRQLLFQNDKRKFLLVFWGAQAFVMLTYSMSGFMKLYGAIDQFLQSQTNIFSPDAAALHIAYWLSGTGQTSFIGPTVVEYPLLGWLPLLIMFYFELFALYAVFKPSLHRIWALGLILFLHIGSYITMNILFEPNIFMLLILFFNSPFSSSSDSPSKIILDMPFFGWTIRVFRAKLIK